MTSRPGPKGTGVNFVEMDQDSTDWGRLRIQLSDAQCAKLVGKKCVYVNQDCHIDYANVLTVVAFDPSRGNRHEPWTAVSQLNEVQKFKTKELYFSKREMDAIEHSHVEGVTKNNH